MYTRLCLFLQPNRRPPQTAPQRRKPGERRPDASRGQVLVIFAVALVALILFIGLAVDAGTLYLTYGQLKRAVDAGAVAAANEFKRTEDISLADKLNLMEHAVEEQMRLHDIDPAHADVHVYICDADEDGLRDENLQTLAPQFYLRCPTSAEAPRKLIWVDADLEAPLYFLHMLGFENINLNTNAIAEAAPVDVVIVIDISESMALRTTSPTTYLSGDYNPNDPTTGCNTFDTCMPLKQAKTAATALINTLYEGYDRVAVVTFDTQAVSLPIDSKSGVPVHLTDSMANAAAEVNGIQLHDDPPYNLLPSSWIGRSSAPVDLFNPVNPEDRDGDGQDLDAADMYPGGTCTPDDDLWDESLDPYGWGGVPCDRDGVDDVFDFNRDGVWDGAEGSSWAGSMSINSTCTGCGMREAANVLKESGRSNAVWVIVFLSDGIVNMSDTSTTRTDEDFPDNLYNGFCTGGIDDNIDTQGFWAYPWCVDRDPAVRVCIDDDSGTCPPGTTYQDMSTPGLINAYSTLDYALDMIDDAALTHSSNTGEPAGNDIAIYAIGLGDAGRDLFGTGPIGEQLLRYMAAVGDDGDRTTDPCAAPGTGSNDNCGQYYYAPDGNALLPIFEDIATRIYTRIAE
ncbi:MAG: pilus assembly protein TadG-related protein [Anaerolineaceae bacterium]|nr:pilus assembly protein TadG-related protein [Anaerolineaceae bacterium]